MDNGENSSHKDQTTQLLPRRAADRNREPDWDQTNVRTAFEPGNQRGRSNVISRLSEALAPVSLGVRRDMLEEAVAVGNSNFQLTVPLVRLPGRGLDLTLDLTYNSRLWHKAGNQIYFDIDADWPAPGWSLGFGSMVIFKWAGEESPLVYNGMLVDADGTRHPYDWSWGYGPTTELVHFDGHATDGSLIDYRFENHRRDGKVSSAKARYPDGTVVDFGACRGSTCGGPPPGGERGVVYPTRITDANGNYITITYRNDTGPELESVTDTVGRKISFHYDAQNYLTAITGPGLGGETRTFIRFNYMDLKLARDQNYGFSNVLKPVVPDPEPSVIKAIYYPSSATGYWFGDQDSYSGYGMVSKVSEQHGMHFTDAPLDEQGTITPGATTRQRTYDYPSIPNPYLEDTPRYTEMTETWEAMDVPEAKTKYKLQQSATPRQVEIEYPDKTRSVQLAYNKPGQFDDGLVYQHDIYDANDVLLQQTSVEWSENPWDGARVKRTKVKDEWNPAATTEFRYGPKHNQLTKVLEYDYDGRLLRRVDTTYVASDDYENRNIFNLPEAVEVYNRSESAPTSRTEYSYDGGPLKDTPGVVSHSDPATDKRGNITQVKTYADAASRKGATKETRRYDITGNLISTSVRSGEQTSYGYTSAYQYAYPEVQTSGADSSTSPARVTTKASYDFNTGLLRSDD